MLNLISTQCNEHSEMKDYQLTMEIGICLRAAFNGRQCETEAYLQYTQQFEAVADLTADHKEHLQVNF